ncbi:hypothetical protein SAMD00079811_28000 [Scytonema sp. HK-05]|nr:hypothetical protein SAMD00079811_28000 [Scytonema sp. HK-05]
MSIDAPTADTPWDSPFIQSTCLEEFPHRHERLFCPGAIEFCAPHSPLRVCLWLTPRLSPLAQLLRRRHGTSRTNATLLMPGNPSTASGSLLSPLFKINLVQFGVNRATLRVHQSPTEGNPPAALVHHLKSLKSPFHNTFDF